MKRLGILVLALAALAALLGGCGGGGDEVGILAVVFRLDGESPILSAYVGDPAEDPFELPAGRYYIEALDQDDVVLSLGVVEIEAGEAVEFPASFDSAGGVADAERAQSLKRVAAFLIDVELSELTFLEAVTGGFTELPFDTAVEPDAASVQELFGLYAEIVAQEDALQTALSQIEGRAEVSMGNLYVRSPWAPAAGWPELLKKKLNDYLFGDKGLLSWMKHATTEGQRERILKIAEQIPEQERGQVFNNTPTSLTGNAYDFNSWIDEIKRGDLDHELSAIYGQLYSADPEAAARAKQRPIDVHAEEGAEGVNHGAKKLVETYKKVPIVGKLIDTTEKALEWEEYAKKLAKDLGGTLEESGRAHIQKQLEEKIKSHLKERAVDLPSLTDTGIDKLAEYLAKKTVDKLPKLPRSVTPTAAVARTATPAAPTATPWAAPTATPRPTATPAATATAEATATPAPDTGWIEGYVQGIANEWLNKGYGGIDVAVAADDLRQCLTDRVVNLGLSRDQAIAECPSWLFEPSSTPEPTETPTAEPAETATPEETETPSPTLEPQDVTATGSYVNYSLAPGEAMTGNTITLRFSTGGGEVTGEGRIDVTTPPSDPCPGGTRYFTCDYDGGTYNPETKTLSGTCKSEAGHQRYWLEVVETESGGTELECELRSHAAQGSINWQATWEDGVVKGSQGDYQFELTVQGWP